MSRIGVPREQWPRKAERGEVLREIEPESHFAQGWLGISILTLIRGEQEVASTPLFDKQAAQFPKEGACSAPGKGVVEEALKFTYIVEKIQGEKDTNNETQEILRREVYCAKGARLVQERN